MYILGIWDGHDSGAAIVNGNRILVAINEERLSRRKLEICFPEKSIVACLKYLNLSPSDISHVAASTYDFSKTLTRVFPHLKEEYYQLRRRKKTPGIFVWFKKLSKYKLTELGPSGLTKFVSRFIVKKELRKLGFENISLYLFDHHEAHAAAAAFCSGYEDCAVITLDGIGDGLSGSVRTLKDGKLELINAIPGRASLGIFFEHVTNLLNMRELEDEGKVMALANYCYPIKDEENPLIDFFRIEGASVIAKYGAIRMYRELQKILWGHPSEQFAYMAQRTLEIKAMELVQNVLRITGRQRLALAGGIFSNIKVNMHISNLPGIEDIFVFPHMGDGGLAVGAALCANYALNHISRCHLSDIFLGLDYSDAEIETVLMKYDLHFDKKDNIVQEAAKLIAEGEIVFWFQGRMEYGPRALGHRSILARADSEELKNKLNYDLKMRVWYQPFCPTMLREDSLRFLEDAHCRPNQYMTMGYAIKPEQVDKIIGVVSIDGTCRPQIIDDENDLFYSLLNEIKKLTGKGVVLNTSLNIHGDPLVCSPEDAIRTFLRTPNKYMAIHDYLVKK